MKVSVLLNIILVNEIKTYAIPKFLKHYIIKKNYVQSCQGLCTVHVYPNVPNRYRCHNLSICTCCY